MLCEQCQAQEATIHVTLVVGPGGDMSKRDFCQLCYPEVEAEHLRSYNLLAGVPPPFTIDVQHITASEYFEASERAQRNGVDGPAYKRISSELRRLPDARRRLALEMLTMASEALARAEDPWSLVVRGCGFGGAVQWEEMSPYTALLEKIISRAFDLLGNGAYHAPVYHLSFGLRAALLALRRVRPARLCAVLCSLRQRAGGIKHES